MKDATPASVVVSMSSVGYSRRDERPPSHPDLHSGLSQRSIAVQRHHDHNNSYRRKHLTGAGLQFQKFSLLSRQGVHGTQADRMLEK